MNVQEMAVSQEAALAALREYRQHRNVYDARDWEIERIYRQIAKGKTVISVASAIRGAGLDELNRPRLAFGRADDESCRCSVESGRVVFSRPRTNLGKLVIDWPGVTYKSTSSWISAVTPRIPPQHRPASGQLSKYHILWEADWKQIPRDPYLLKRIGKDAFVVLAAWDLTDVELSVLRAHAQ